MASSHTISIFAALIAGLAATAHCFAMCGGIASALGLHARAAGTRVGTYGVATLYQIGRLCGYTLAGAICGFIGSQAATLFEFVRLGPVLRAASGLLIVLLGVRLLFQWNALQWIEQLGAKFWVRLRPLLHMASTRTAIAKPLAMGMLWSLLPCGLVYSMLTFAALSADSARGALIMFAFGLGTLPSMLTASLLAARVQALLSRPAARFASGSILVCFGVWMIVMATMVSGGGHAH